MYHQPESPREDVVSTKVCAADCGNCPTFPAPFRRAGEAQSCNFSRITLDAGEGVSFPVSTQVGITRLLFVMSGSLNISVEGDYSRLVTSMQCAPLVQECRMEALDDNTSLVILAMDKPIEFCESDLFGEELPRDLVVPDEAVPVLSIHPAVEQLLEGVFRIPELCGCTRYHRLKSAELFMMLRLLYTPTELVYLFQRMVHPRDNFRVFVSNNYDKVQGVGQLAALAGMSLSVFKRRFAEHFNDSVYHWMMQQKAQKIFDDIRDGADSTKSLMEKYGFRHYTQFSRFCKNYLQATPAQLIATSRSRKPQKRIR